MKNYVLGIVFIMVCIVFQLYLISCKSNEPVQDSQTTGLVEQKLPSPDYTGIAKM